MLRAYLWLTFCVIAWGSNFVFGKILVQDFSSALLTSLRLFFIVIFLAGLALYKGNVERLNKKDILPILSLGVIGVFINQLTFFIGLQTADPTTSALIIATAPILTGFLAAIFLKEKLTVRMLIGSVIAIIGIAFVVTKGSFSSIQLDKGLIWIVITMVTFAIMIILTRHLSHRMEAFTVTFYSNIVGFLVSVPFVFIIDNPIRMGARVFDWAFLIGTAILVHGIATLVWNSNIRHVDASKASVLSNLEPFVAMLMGLIILYKPITGIEIVGSILIIGGVLFSTYQKRT